jgi:NAD(P)H-hydrate repair Nnr-like enzyme with NAD(P)H-hydrate epimerase domain
LCPVDPARVPRQRALWVHDDFVIPVLVLMHVAGAAVLAVVSPRSPLLRNMTVSAIVGGGDRILPEKARKSG